MQNIMTPKWTFLLLLSFTTALNAETEKMRFDNHRLYGVHIDTVDQLELFRNLEENTDGFLLWNYPVLGDSVDVMVAPHKLSEFNQLVQLYDLQFRLKMKNVQRFPSQFISYWISLKFVSLSVSIIDAETPAVRPKNFGWSAYNNYTEIYKWLDELLEEYPTILSNFTVGTTYEGREIRGVKLAHNPVISWRLNPNETCIHYSCCVNRKILRFSLKQTFMPVNG